MKSDLVKSSSRHYGGNLRWCSHVTVGTECHRTNPLHCSAARGRIQLNVNGYGWAAARDGQRSASPFSRESLAEGEK